MKGDVAGGCGEVGRWAEGSRGRAAIRSCCPAGRLKPLRACALTQAELLV